jgi:hypothetical protein
MSNILTPSLASPAPMTTGGLVLHVDLTECLLARSKSSVSVHRSLAELRAKLALMREELP